MAEWIKVYPRRQCQLFRCSECDRTVYYIDGKVRGTNERSVCGYPFCPWCKTEMKKNGEITAKHPNGYYGNLIGRTMTIYKEGKEVLHTYSATAKTEKELYDVLEDMPEFLNMLRR